MSAATLQISLAPPDLRHAAQVLPHQLRVWATQVKEVICLVDLRPPAGCSGAERAQWERDGRALLDLVRGCLQAYPDAHFRKVDYSYGQVRAVGDVFFAGHAVPAKDFRGGPFYAYFHGLLAAEHDLVLHLDSDMLFGGGSRMWLREAATLIADQDEILACRPLPGPPTADGRLVDQAAVREQTPRLAYRFESFTTRVFLVDRRRLADRLAPLSVRSHASGRRLLARDRLLDSLPMSEPIAKLRPLLSLPAYELPERIIGESMSRAGLRRVDFLGNPPGMWSLHPRQRSARFYQQLPALVARIEDGDVTAEQRGRYDLHESMLG